MIDVRDILNELENNSEQIEALVQGEILFGAVGGSYSLGLHNESSDIDAYLMLTNTRQPSLVHSKVDFERKGKNITVDLMCVPFEYALSQLKEYQLLKKRYPTKLNYSEEDKRANIDKVDVERPDFIRSLFYRIILADHVLNTDKLLMMKDQFISGMRIIDLVDYQFTRLYGNYYEKISGNMQVPVRKYLYCAHEAMTCAYLMTNKKKPPMIFCDLLEVSDIDTRLKSLLMDLHAINKKAAMDKKALLVDCNEDINSYIIHEIDCIKRYLVNEENYEEVLLM